MGVNMVILKEILLIEFIFFVVEFVKLLGYVWS